MTALQDWLKSGDHLPPALRDFHDQKDAFKAVWRVVERKRASAEGCRYLDGMTWVAAQVFVIDFFLWWMACHGYTLQKTRRKGVEFADLATTIREMKDEDAAAFRKMLDERKGEATP